MSTIGIEKIGCYRPNDSLNVFELGKRFDADPEFIRSKLGFERLGRKGSGEDTSDMCVRAFKQLQSESSVNPADIECLIVVTQTPDGHGLPHVSATLHKKLELSPQTACFDISLGCSGFVQGLKVATAFMEQNGLTRGLLCTADPYSKVIDPDDRNVVMLFGDAAACTLLSSNPRFTVGKINHLCGSEFSHAIRVDPHSGKLTMDGNLVFRFVARHVPGQIKQCIADNGLVKDDIDLFLVHQGSKYIVDTLRKALGVEKEQMPFLAAESGNTVSSSLPLVLEKFVDSDVNIVLLSGFGVGLQSSTTIIRRMRD